MIGRVGIHGTRIVPAADVKNRDRDARIRKRKPLRAAGAPMPAFLRQINDPALRKRCSRKLDIDAPGVA
ncbi:MAG: hypothetical protein OZ924_04010 [Burkholderiaceae bacterium]|nr:hypothetical protein [Burkholderiaceae bacterium]